MSQDAERLGRIVAAIESSPLDVLLCDSATEVLLLTGYCPVMGCSIAVCTGSGELAVIVPEDEMELARQTSGARILSYKPAGLHTLASPLELLKQPLQQLLDELGLHTSHFGLQLTEGVQPSSYLVAYQFRLSLLDLLKELYPKAKVSAADDLLGRLKARNTPLEVAAVSRACKVAQPAFAKVATSLRAGMRETDVIACAQSAFEIACGEAAFHRSHGEFFCMSGPNSATAAAAYARTRKRLLEEGDLVMIHANTCGDGYWTDITRTFTVGAESARQQQMRAAITEARAAAIKAVRPGAKAAAVDGAARDLMKAHGMGEAFKHATGHGVGFSAANPNGLPRIHPHSPDVLEVGMIFNIEPAAYFDGYGGIRHCDVVTVTPDGCEVLTDF